MSFDITSNRGWYSTSANPARANEGLDDYCRFCVNNFRRFHPMVNNVCQSCGRVAEPVMRDDQENIRVTSLNETPDPNTLKGVSVNIDYSPLESDPTTQGNIRTDGTPMNTGRGAGEAIRLINEADRMQSKYYGARMRGEGFIVKTNVKDQKKVLFDEKQY